MDQLPESLQPWFEVDPWYLDSLLKTWSESSTADPLLREVLDIALQQFIYMLVTICFFGPKHFTQWNSYKIVRSPANYSRNVVRKPLIKHRFR